MTFIVSIQLKDSIIVATDHKTYSNAEGNFNDVKEDTSLLPKMYHWKDGIITGAGEHYLIHNAVYYFKKIAENDIRKLPDCLKASRILREMQVGSHQQIDITSLICSTRTATKAQLYNVSPTENKDVYILKPYEDMNIDVKLCHVNNHIMPLLKELYQNLKNRGEFNTCEEWYSHYIPMLNNIFKQQNLSDNLMSSSFDIYFQTASSMDYFTVPRETPILISKKEHANF